MPDKMKENNNQSQELLSLPLLEYDVLRHCLALICRNSPGSLEVLVMCPGSISGDASAGLQAC